jgi:hypothetical protein
MSSPPGRARRAAISSRIRSSAARLLRAKRRQGVSGPRSRCSQRIRIEGGQTASMVRSRVRLEGGDAGGLLHAEHGADDDVERDGLGGVRHDERLAELPGAGALEGAVADDAGVRPHAGAVQRRGQQAALAGVALAVDEDQRALAEQRLEVAGVEAGDVSASAARICLMYSGSPVRTMRLPASQFSNGSPNRRRTVVRGRCTGRRRSGRWRRSDCRSRGCRGASARFIPQAHGACARDPLGAAEAPRPRRLRDWRADWYARAR